MAPKQAIHLVDVLHASLPRTELLDKARELGVVQRQRKTNVFALLSVVVLTVPVRGCISRASMFRSYLMNTGERLSRSAFYGRFSKPLAALLRDLLEQRMVAARQQRPRTTGVLAGFTDVLIADATSIRLHSALRRLWPGSNEGTAILKVHAMIRAVSGELVRCTLTKGTSADGPVFGANHSHRGTLFLLDQAYNAASLWWRIHRLGAFFVVRLPGSYQPTIEHSNRHHRGRSRKVQGKKLRLVLQGLKRAVLDVDCLFRITVRPYTTDKPRRFRHPFRVVALRNRKTKRYHLYVTNLTPERMPAENIGALYRLRWEVELAFKAGKSGCGLAELNSRNPVVVRILVYAALLRHSLAMHSRRLASQTLGRSRWMGPLLWLDLFNQYLTGALRRLLGRTRAWPVSLRRLAKLATCPDRSRLPHRCQLLWFPPLEARI